jgi:arginine decarboxylase-like protein
MKDLLKPTEQHLRQKGLLSCSKKCIDLNQECHISDCKHWIKFSNDHNCTLVAIYNNGPMTLRQVAERVQLSFARVKQIETKAFEKIKKRLESFDSYF